MKTKCCTKCKIEKSLSEFNKNRSAKDGLDYWCRACKNARRKTYNYPPSIGPKICSGCSEIKPAKDFGRNKRRKNGLSSRCKLCQSARKKARNHPRSMAPQTCRSCGKTMLAENFTADTKNTSGLSSWCRVCISAKIKERVYGVDRQKHLAMLNFQGWKCLCGAPLTMSSPIDHCHQTGAIRGILCQNCNKPLGHVKDSPIILRKLADYLEQPNQWGYAPQRNSRRKQ